MPVRIGASVYDHSEASVDHFAPAHAAAVVDGHPGRPPETVSDDVLHGHVRGEAGTVVDVGGLAVRGICSRNVVMVTAQDYRSADAAFPYGLVECKGDLRTALAVGIEDTRLRPYHKIVAGGLLYPVDVVIHLSAYLFRGGGAYLPEHLCRDPVGECQVGRVF